MTWVVVLQTNGWLTTPLPNPGCDVAAWMYDCCTVGLGTIARHVNTNRMWLHTKMTTSHKIKILQVICCLLNYE